MRVRIRDVVAPVFWPVHRAIARGTVQALVAKGGRGSGKSSYISIELVLQLLRHPACHAVVLRKIGGTLRTSVYAQIQWAIGALGLAKQFRCTVSPMECTYLPTGQKILFFGTDDPGARKADGALPHLWRVPAGVGPFDADSRHDAAKHNRCDHCGRSRDYCRPAGVCPCSRKNAAAHTGILQKGGAESAELRRAVDWEKLKTAIRFEDAGITICAEENEEHLS